MKQSQKFIDYSHCEIRHEGEIRRQREVGRERKREGEGVRER